MLLIVLLWAVGSGTPPDDLSDAQRVERIDQYLGAIDRPVSKERWQALGVRAIPMLEAIANDPTELPSRRSKAIWALAVISPKEVTTRLAPFTQDERNPP